jgi:hypothetical protein
MAIKLQSGYVHLAELHVAADAVKLGILAVDPKARTANLHDEPLLCSAIEDFGDGLVKNSATRPDTDPVLMWLQSSLYNGGIAGLDLITTLKGDVYELMFVWHLLRAVLIHRHNHDGRDPLLVDVLRPLMPVGFLCPPTLDGATVAVTRAQRPPPTATVFHHLFREGVLQRDVVFYDIETVAGADVVFSVFASDRGTIVDVQAKNRGDTSLADCLRSSCMAWQYVNRAHRALVAQGAAVAWPAQRLAFAALAGQHADLFAHGARVAFSFNDFQPAAVAIVNGLNAHAEYGLSPIWLCRSAEAAFGGRLHDSLRARTEESLASSTANEDFLLAQDIATVQCSGALRRLDSPTLALLARHLMASAPTDDLKARIAAALAAHG